MKSFLFGTSMVLFGAVGATAQSTDTTNRAPLEVTPERELMEEPAIDPMTPSEFEQRDLNQGDTDTMQIDSTSLSPEDGDPQTSKYNNPQPAVQPTPEERTKPQRPNGTPKPN